MSKAPLFIGIRWTLWGALLILILFINITLYRYFSQQLQQQYQIAQQQFVTENLKVLDGALTSSYYKLLEIGQTIQLMSQTDSNIPYHEYIQSVIKKHFSEFESQGILNGAAVFDASGKLMFSSGSLRLYSEQIAQVALQNESPVRKIICDNECFRMIAIPLLNSGEVQGVLVVGRWLHDLVIDFKTFSGVEIGIARTNTKQASASSPAWPINFIHLTQRNRNLQILHSLTLVEAEYLNDTLYQVDIFDRKYEVFFTVPGHAALTDTVWVLIADGTIRHQTMNAFKARIGFGLMISSIFLLIIAYIVILRMTRRLHKISMHQHIDAKKGMTVPKQKIIFEDEINSISRYVNELHTKLNSMTQSRLLADQKIDEIAQALRIEKERVVHLVGNSENIIVTQNCDGIVLTINEVGQKLLGPSQTDVPHLFTDLFYSGEENQLAVDAINRIYTRLEQLVCSDSQKLDSQGQLHSLFWIHSYIDGYSEHRSIILSIGMEVTVKG